MVNLKKREIIILAIAALFVLYALYVYLIADRGKGKIKSRTEPVKIETSIAGINDELNASRLSDFDNYIIKKAPVKWGGNPFLKRELYRALVSKDSGGGIAAKIIYSGYVDSEKKQMAVLNNIEYRIGEELKEEGYVLKQITPSKVVIFEKQTGSNFEIPIQE